MLAEAGGYDALYLDVNYGLAGARQDGTALREIPLR
jgi:hypothetical protein